MLDCLVRRFVPDAGNAADPAVRTAYGVLAGALGIFFNLLLFCVKLPIGLSMGSIAIMSDAFNNISDMGSSAISLVGARMAGRKPDREHPFGHGRLEYVAALIVALLILVVGVELFKESATKLFQPEPVSFNLPLVIALALSMLVKLFMYHYNRSFGRRIDSSVLRATAKDSLNDVAVTGVVVLSTVVGRYTAFPVDAAGGLLVSLFILYSGFGVAKDTVDLLLGGRNDPELSGKIRKIVLSGETVSGVHDLILHDYGPGRVMASAHAEVPDDANILRAHEEIDELEQRVQRELGIPLVLHMDPVSVGNARVDGIREGLVETVRSVNPAFSLHDFRITDGENRINLIFDLVVPCELGETERERAVAEIRARMSERDARYRCVIQLDDNFGQQ